MAEKSKNAAANQQCENELDNSQLSLITDAELKQINRMFSLKPSVELTAHSCIRNEKETQNTCTEPQKHLYVYKGH